MTCTNESTRAGQRGKQVSEWAVCVRGQYARSVNKCCFCAILPVCLNIKVNLVLHHILVSPVIVSILIHHLLVYQSSFNSYFLYVYLPRLRAAVCRVGQY